jgi:lipopolysaccharide/colanic/teichoic acid biosynthesis glycosyltransferase
MHPSISPHPTAIEFRCPDFSVLHERFKRAFDLALGGCLFIAAIPIISVAWLLVRLTSSGPGFYTQARVGRFGEPFMILKLRTMYHECEKTSGVCWARKQDSRITPLGRILRKTHVDELPQLLNVIRGDMSLVGPRPERPEFVGPLNEVIPRYKSRLLVRPGLTGLAQIQLPPDSSIESVRRKLLLDLCYIERRSPWLDVRLLSGTSLYLFGLSYFRVRTLLRLPYPEVSEPVESHEESLIDTVIDPSIRAVAVSVGPADRSQGS